MCRIAGIADVSYSPAEMQGRVKQMCTLLQHGGPDDEGIYSDVTHSLVLGHRRLALIDLSPAGHQPMHFMERFIISFNGEIYNFPTLKKELELLGQVFFTHSDTEVILAAFAQWGVLSFNKLKGMFAFALYDKAEGQLFLVRDPSGIKPLYYSITTTGIRFASEMRAFNVFENNQANAKWPVLQLAYGHLPEPQTTLEDIHPLHKGCFYQYHIPSHTGSLQSFAHYSFSSVISEERLAKEQVKDGTEQAVSSHLLSDAPIGVFLSGGIDSSIITSIAAKTQAQQLQTLSLYFNEAEFSEKRYQDILIEKLQCNYYQHLLTEKEFEQSFPAILQDMDMPSCDGVNTWFISKYAKVQGLKAVLSGIGGDELFGGYPSFERMAWARRLQAAPASLLTAGRNSRNKRLKRTAYLRLEGIKGLYLFLRGQFTVPEIARQLDANEAEIWTILEDSPLFSPLNHLDNGNMASWMEMNLYMQNQLLRDADVMSMAHGIEIRVPLLDENLVKTAFSIAPQIKFKKKLPKYLLTGSFKSELPEAIFNRHKMGFSFPFTDWLANSDYVKTLLQAGNTATKIAYTKFLKGEMHWSNLMSIIMLNVRGVG